MNKLSKMWCLYGWSAVKSEVTPIHIPCYSCPYTWVVVRHVVVWKSCGLRTVVRDTDSKALLFRSVVCTIVCLIPTLRSTRDCKWVIDQHQPFNHRLTQSSMTVSVSDSESTQSLSQWLNQWMSHSLSEWLKVNHWISHYHWYSVSLSLSITQ